MLSKLHQIQGTSYERCHIQQISTLTPCFPMRFRVRYISTVHVVSAIAFQSMRIQPCTVTNYKPKQTNNKQKDQLIIHNIHTSIHTEFICVTSKYIHLIFYTFLKERLKVIEMFWDVGLEQQRINDKPNNTHSPRKKEEGDKEKTAKREREIQTIRVKITLSCMY